MKTKKKQKQKSVAAAEVVTHEDLDSTIHNHTLFFDKLIELIPAKFYLPTDDNEKPWFQGLSKAAKAKAKKQTQENIKKSRKDRLDPEKPSSSTLDLLKQNLSKQKVTTDNITEESVTYEELRERLHRKLEQFRSTRNCSDHERKNDDKEFKRGVHLQEKKRRRESEGFGSGESKEIKVKKDELEEKVKNDAIEASKELVFGHVKLQDGEIDGNKKRRVSKQKELERAKKLEEVKKSDPEKGEAIAKKEAWKAAMNRASGIKVHDDAKLLKKSIVKGKKRQQKNAGKWEERVQSMDQLKAEKQKKRSENIAGRINDKKMRKIAKREKKWMRPGFEGRKQDFITNGSTS
ncbi:uncharacterized protein [Cicer arietinum]|uniref:Surfeit locus protein 6 homolog n=1 Tax=Cicer arietinum TaxID=3827 RepID=A0A3Q7YFM8_CICAR|nr:surfeit locus protein 6 homolog [Cicer arietinum]